MPALNFLLFDHGEDDNGTSSWDAMASVTANRLPELQQEVEAVLRWAHSRFNLGALDDGADWDMDLQAQDDTGQSLPLSWHASTGQLELRAAPTGRTTLMLTLCGTAQFAQAFEQTWQEPE